MTDVVGLVQADLNVRRKVGLERYGQVIDVGDGRDWLIEAYEEALDLLVYLRAGIELRDRATRPDEPVFRCGAAVIGRPRKGP